MARDKDATGRRTGGPEAQLRQKTKEREGRGHSRRTAKIVRDMGWEICQKLCRVVEEEVLD